MGLRRFQNFSLGALNAGRLNELIDAVARLQSQVNGMISGGEPVRYRIMARITDDGIAVGTQGLQGPSGRECEKAIRCVLYPFEEIMLSIKDEGQIENRTCISAIVPQDAITSERGAHLLVFEETPSLPKESIVVAHLASMTGLTATDKQQVYVTSTGGGGGEAKLYSIVGYDDFGRYEARIVDQPATEPIILLNVYELSQYYSALGPPQNPCAELQPRRLVPGDLVIGFKIGPLHYTCAPTSFTVTCVNCGGTPLGIQALYTESGAQSAVASQMLGG